MCACVWERETCANNNAKNRTVVNNNNNNKTKCVWWLLLAANCQFGITWEMGLCTNLWEIILVTLIEVNCRLVKSHAENPVLCEVEKGNGLAAYGHLFPDTRFNVSSCFKSQLPWLTFHAGLCLDCELQSTPFFLNLILSRHFITVTAKELRKYVLGF